MSDGGVIEAGVWVGAVTTSSSEVGDGLMASVSTDD